MNCPCWFSFLPCLQQHRFLLDICDLFKLCNCPTGSPPAPDTISTFFSVAHVAGTFVNFSWRSLTVNILSILHPESRSYNAIQVGSIDFIPLLCFKCVLSYLFAPPSRKQDPVSFTSKCQALRFKSLSGVCCW